ncbi:MAG: glycosyltransferase family 39 protein [Candidatus Micrarchaeaceae archaeon]
MEEQRSGSGRRKNAAYASMALAAIIILGLLIGFMIHSTLDPLYDDLTYITLAHQMLAGNFTIGYGPFAISLGVIVPLAVSFMLFGYNILSAALPTITAYIVLIVSIFLIGRELQGNKLAALAAFLTATSPIVTPYVFRVLPDISLGALVALSFYLFLIGYRKRSSMLLLASGFIIGLSPFVRLDGLMLAFFYVFSILVASKIQKEKRITVYAYVIIGLLLALAIYFLTFFVYTGNPLHPIYAFGSSVRVINKSSLANNLNILINLLSPASSTNLRGPYLYTMGPIFLFAIFGSAVALLKRSKFAVIAIFNLSTFFYYFLGTGSPTEYIPLLIWSRSLATILVSVSIMAAYLIVEIYESAERESKVYAALGAVALVFSITALYYNGYNSVYQYNFGNMEQSMLYREITNYIINSTGGANATLYISSSGGGLLISNYINFSMAYSKISAISIWLNVGLSGNCTYSNNSFLAAISLGGPPSVAAQNIKEAHIWAGSGCSLVYDKNITVGIGTATIYKIEKG